MGEKLFTVVTLSLIVVFSIDWFLDWYDRFLDKRPVKPRVKNLFLNIFWVSLTLLFWHTLLNRDLPEKFTISHFAFALFIFSVHGLVQSFIKRSK
ncbi:hypothetical protein JW935_26365 [candidate division KSB1 bacterium]|nr:hypothetical protein [candidate division KSB1 bacterium]